MTTWNDIANLNVEDDSLVEMRDRVADALHQGNDPSPEVAVALLDTHTLMYQIAVNLTQQINTLRDELTTTQVYVLKLEARIEQAGLSLAEAPARITNAHSSEE